MKAAQLLATIPDALPPEYANELAQLQANAPAMGWAFVKRRMATELGPDWPSRFVRFDKEASFAASLGQVHHAELPESREVACKLQYPDMASALEADLDQLKVVFAIGQRLDPAIRTDEIHAEISDAPARGARLPPRGRARGALPPYPARRSQRACARRRAVALDRPAAHDGLARRRAAAQLEQPLAGEKDRLAVNMFRAWYVPFYSYGVIHGDPHLGNYTVRADGSVNLMDFGCVRVFPPRFVRGSIELYRAPHERRSRPRRCCLRGLGLHRP